MYRPVPITPKAQREIERMKKGVDKIKGKRLVAENKEKRIMEIEAKIFNLRQELRGLKE